MAAGKRSSAAKRTAGIKGKRITAKQRVARVKNIAIARSHKKRTGGKLLPHSKKVAARPSGGKGISMKEAVKRQVGRRKNTASNQKLARKELNKAISYDKVKSRRRIKDYYSSGEGYSKKKRLRKRAEMFLMKKMGVWIGK